MLHLTKAKTSTLGQSRVVQHVPPKSPTTPALAPVPVQEASGPHWHVKVRWTECSEIKGPDNPTRQLLPIMSTKCCSGDGEGRKDKGRGGGLGSKTKLYVKDGV